MNIESEEQADELLASIEEPKDESSVEPGAKPQAETSPAEQAAIDEFALTVGGKEIKAKRDQVLKWAQMGYDAPNRIGELNKKLEAYAQKEAQLKELEEKFGPVDKYVRENPQFWDLVQNQYQQQLSQVQANPQLNALMQKVGELESYKNEAEQRRQEFVRAQEDQAYQSELENLKKMYPKIDLHSPDESGKSLEYKVLEYARDNGIKKLTTAFKDFYFDELVKLKEEEAKEKVVQDKQSKSKLGILGISPTPTKRVSSDVKGKSYNDLEREALEELGIAR